MTLDEWVVAYLELVDPDDRAGTLVGALWEELVYQRTQTKEACVRELKAHERIHELLHAPPPGFEKWKDAIREVLDREDPSDCSC